MDRRRVILASAALAGTSFGATAAASRPDGEELSLADIQARCTRGELSSRVLVRACLTRIDATNRCDPGLRAVLECNPAALDIASQREAKGPLSEAAYGEARARCLLAARP